jgi:hypothetical protein
MFGQRSFEPNRVESQHIAPLLALRMYDPLLAWIDKAWGSEELDLGEQEDCKS